MQIFTLQSFLIALLVGAASGSVGAFIILRRMALVGDALSHVALPGIALALFYGIDPFWGVIVFLLGASLIIWRLESQTKLPTDAIVGLLFTTSIAIGVLTIPNPEIVESLFGEFSKLPWNFFFFLSGTAAVLTITTFLFARQFLFITISPEMAKVGKIGDGWRLLLLLTFSMTVAIGIKLVGALLMGALTIIPASIAKNITKNMSAFMLSATLLGAGIAATGTLLAHYFSFLPGPTIILLGAALFIISLVFKKS